MIKIKLVVRVMFEFNSIIIYYIILYVFLFIKLKSNVGRYPCNGIGSIKFKFVSFI